MAAPTRPAPTPQPQPIGLACACVAVVAIAPVMATAARARAAILVLIDIEKLHPVVSGRCGPHASWTEAVRFRFESRRADSERRYFHNYCSYLAALFGPAASLITSKL